MHTPQGDRFDITLLRPIGWLESCNAQVGSSIHLVVSEQGLDGLAEVLAIEPCPSISSGVGRVVTGTFTHVRGGILRIRLAGLAEPLGVTSNHSIYSADRLDFVPAGELRVGETLRNLDGDVRIESIEQLGSEERVYNLEIHGEHVFRVASSGLLVHNSSGAEISKPSLNAHKEALGKVHTEVEKLPKGEPGKFGSPQAGNSLKGYRLDPPHPDARTGSPESGYHLNW
jgi:hypothetical protein